jgi:group I intron endonuclease
MNFLIPENVKKASGIYKITCKETRKIYIGSAENLLHRYNGHKTDFKRGTHANSYLLNSYLKYGSENFDFELIELAPIDQLLEREQFYLDSTKCYEPDIGFNICKIAGKVDMTPEIRKRIGDKNRGSKRTEEQKKIMSEAQRNKTISVEGLENLKKGGEKRRGRPRSEDTKNKISISKQQDPYIYTDTIRQKMKEAYEENKEYRLGLLSEARKKLIGKTLSEEEVRSATIGGYKQALTKKTFTDKDILDLINKLRDDPNFEVTKALGKSYSTFTDIFKCEKPAYFPVLIKIGYVQLGGSSMKDLRNPEFIAKLNLDIEFLQGADNLIEDPVELYDFLNNIRTLDGNLAE